jgi:tetratricopeptide (TPR) repeat protein
VGANAAILDEEEVWPELPGFSDLTSIGAGGFAQVFRAIDASCNVVAIKLTRGAADLRFQREVELLRRVGPPLVPAVFDAVRLPDGRGLLAMELLRGESMATWLARQEEAIPPRSEVLCWGTELAHCVDALHAQGVIHRDIKPENVFLRAEGHAALLDFGLARSFADAENPESVDAQLTRTGDFLGSVLYTAPEQGVGKRVGHAADLYSVAVIYYEMLCGRPPFVGDVAQVRRALVWNQPPAPSSLAALPPAVDEVFERALAKEPSERFDTASALMTALDAALNQPLAVGPATSSEDGTRMVHKAEGKGKAMANRREIVLLAVVGTSANPALQELATRHGGDIVRMNAIAQLVAFAELDVEGGLRSALQMADVVASQPGARCVVHVAELRVRRAAHGMMTLGTALDRYEEWLDRGEAMERATALITPEARGRIPRAPSDLTERLATVSYVDPGTLWPRDGIELELLEQARASREQLGPRITTLLGENGLGKSFLLHYVAQKLHAPTDTLVFELRATPPDVDRGSVLLEQLIRVALDLRPGRVLLAELTAAVEVALDAQLCRVVLPALARIFEMAVAPELGTALSAEPGAERRAIARAIVNGLLRRAQSQPLALFIDDVHLADYTSLDALEMLEAEQRRAPLWVCVTARPELFAARPGWGKSAMTPLICELAPLADESARQALMQLLRPVEFVPARALAQLVELTHGIPMHLVALAHHLRQRGAIRSQGSVDSWFLAAEQLFALGPTSLSERLAERALARLDEELVRFAQLCAIFGESGPRELRAMQRELDPELGFSVLDPARALQSLADAGLLRRGASGYRVCHPMLGEALAASIPVRVRCELHRAALEVLGRRSELPGARIAQHSRAAGRQELAAQLFAALGREAEEQFRYVDAEAFYGSSLACRAGESGSSDERVLTGRSRVRYQMGRFPAALDDLRAALAGAEARGDRQAVVELLLELASALDWCHQFGEAAAAAERCHALVGELESPRLKGRAFFAMARGRCRKGDWAASLPLLEQAVARASACGDSTTRTDALVLQGGVLVLLEQFDRAEQVLDGLIAECAQSGDLLHLAAAHGNRCLLLQARQDWAGAETAARTLMRIAQEIGHFLFERAAHHNLAELKIWHGDFDEALRLATRSRDIEQRFIPKPGPEDTLLLARIHVARNEVEPATRYLDWIRTHCDLDHARASYRHLFRMVDLCCHEVELREWRSLLSDCVGQTELNEHLEIRLAFARWADQRGMVDEVEVCRREALLLAAGSPVWEQRFLALAPLRCA